MNDRLIAALVADAAPVARLRLWPGALAAVLVLALGIAAIAATLGLRADILAGQPAPIVTARALLLAALAVGAGVSASASLRPGAARWTAPWAAPLAVGLAAPAATLVTLADGWSALAAVAPWVSGRVCLAASLAVAVPIAFAATAFARRGAPLRPDRTATLIGLASGAAGTFAYSLACPSGTLAYAGLWYALAVALATLGGRLLLPRWLRW